MRVRLILAAAVAVMGTTVATGAVSAKQPDMCISVNGDLKVQKGTATCTSVKSDGAANVAKATGDGAHASAGLRAGDSGNRATASGYYADAFAGDGDRNTATASGYIARAWAYEGDANRAKASGDNSRVYAGHGDGNRGIATGEYSFAQAEGAANAVTALGFSSTSIVYGDRNTVSATGVPSLARVYRGDGNTVTASGYSSTAFVEWGDANTVTATTDFCVVGVTGSDGETASC